MKWYSTYYLVNIKKIFQKNVPWVQDSDKTQASTLSWSLIAVDRLLVEIN